ncbi:MAG: helix-turn-helix domain-containing protein [Beijerinckiaceae bacterium]|nr:helix-turn-helix domain-containing protein [Beijerinckiaceae bacterium]
MRDDRTTDDNPKNFVQSVVKAFAVLKAFDTRLPELTISEIAQRAQLDRGTSFRLVHTLCHLGYLAAVPRSRRYRMTLKCLELGYTPLARADLKMLARPLLQELVPGIADAASLGMLDGPDVVYVERAQVDLPQLNLDRRAGSRTGAYGAALGHVLLACLPEARQREILEQSNRVRLSERTLVDLDAILTRLVEVRARGYALSDGENAYGLRTVAAAITDADGNPVAGVSLTIHAERDSMEAFAARAVPEVLRVAGELSRAITLSFNTLSIAR